MDSHRLVFLSLAAAARKSGLSASCGLEGCWLEYYHSAAQVLKLALAGQPLRVGKSAEHHHEQGHPISKP